MDSRLYSQTIVSEFDSLWAPYASGFEVKLSK